MVRIHEVRGSIPLISTKRVLDEHLFLLRRICSNGVVLIQKQKTAISFYSSEVAVFCYTATCVE